VPVHDGVDSFKDRGKKPVACGLGEGFMEALFDAQESPERLKAALCLSPPGVWLQALGASAGARGGAVGK
jgi:hypothetical protein